MVFEDRWSLNTGGHKDRFHCNTVEGLSKWDNFPTKDTLLDPLVHSLDLQEEVNLSMVRQKWPFHSKKNILIHYRDPLQCEYGYVIAIL